MFKSIITFLGRTYIDAPLNILYLVILGIIVSQMILLKKISFKYQHVLNGRTDFLVTITELLRFLNPT